MVSDRELQELLEQLRRDSAASVAAAMEKTMRAASMPSTMSMEGTTERMVVSTGSVEALGTEASSTLSSVASSLLDMVVSSTTEAATTVVPSTTDMMVVPVNEVSSADDRTMKVRLFFLSFSNFYVLHLISYCPIKAEFLIICRCFSPSTYVVDQKKLFIYVSCYFSYPCI
jgi:hypothetical protein